MLVSMSISSSYGSSTVAISSLLIALWVAVYPVRNYTSFVKNTQTIITSWLREQPKDILIAGTSTETDLIPTFANRSVLVNKEYFVPFHLGFHDELQRRMMSLIDAYYAESLDDVLGFSENYGVDILLVNRLAFDEKRYDEVWTGPWASRWEPFSPVLATKLDGSRRFVLPDLVLRCGVL